MEHSFSERNIAFLLYEVFDTESLCNNFLFSEHDRISFDLAVGVSIKIASDLMNDLFGEMDRKKVFFDNGNISVNSDVARYMHESGSGGWLEAFSGSGNAINLLPHSIIAVCNFIKASANPALEMFSFYNSLAVNILRKYPDQNLLSPYLELLVSGTAQGSLAFMESTGGNIYKNIKTRARFSGDGMYKITGQKHFVPAVYHTESGNNIFLVTADVSERKDTQITSLFLVPEKRQNQGCYIHNDVAVTGLYEFSGMKGLPYASVCMGDNDCCYGIPVGENGMATEFISEALSEIRIHDAVSASGICSRAFYESLNFTVEKNRKEDASPGQFFQPHFFNDQDVQKLLLFQKSVFEGTLCLALQISCYTDNNLIYGNLPDKNRSLISLLTPLLKFYITEYGSASVIRGIETLGVFGSFTEYPLEQCLRDITHMLNFAETPDDIVSDFVRVNIFRDRYNGFEYLFNEVSIETVKRVHDELFYCRKRLIEMKEIIEELTAKVKRISFADLPSVYNLRLFVELLSLFVIGWQWYKQALSASESLVKRPEGRYSYFYKGKIKTCIYYFSCEFSRSFSIADNIKNDMFDINVNSRELGQ